MPLHPRTGGGDSARSGGRRVQEKMEASAAAILREEALLSWLHDAWSAHADRRGLTDCASAWREDTILRSARLETQQIEASAASHAAEVLHLAPPMFSSSSSAAHGAPFAMPMCRSLPTLSGALPHDRFLGEAYLADEERTTDPSTGERYAYAMTATSNVLNDCDWEEIFRAAGPLEEYISPDITECFGPPILGSQDLELSGRAFVASPPIPVVGRVPTFGDLLEAVKPAPQVPARQLRYGLRERPAGQQTLPSIRQLTSLRRQSETARTQFERKRRSARTRLFASPDSSDEKENKPPVKQEKKSDMKAKVVSSTTTKAAMKTKLRPRVLAHASSRRSLDSVMSPDYVPANDSRPRTTRKSKDCSVPGCTKGARSKGLCKRHGGGKRCTRPGCSRSDQGGGFCIAHGGGKRCGIDGCKNSAQSRGLCKTHGGGKRCAHEGCEKSSQEGGFCRAHSGTRLCKAPVCFNYRHRGNLCLAHANM